MMNNSPAMRVLPTTKDEWVALMLFPLKAYMVVAVPLYEVFRFWFAQSSPPGTSRFGDGGFIYTVANGYAFSVVVLLFGAILQLRFCERWASLKTLTFVGAAVVIYVVLSLR